MKIFDTHAHLGLIVDDPIERIIVAQEARQQGVLGILSICNNLRDFAPLYKNLVNASNVYFAAGVSPSEVKNPGADWQNRLGEILSWKRVVALGETGLDYYRKFGDRKSQIELFVEQLELANRYRKPVVIHNREAGQDVLGILDSCFPECGAVLHCYSEGLDYAERILARHDKLFISFAGNLTYRSARELQQVAQALPLERVLLESESPFMTPSQYRGKRNRPSYTGSTLDAFIALRREDPEVVADTLFANALRFLNISF